MELRWEAYTDNGRERSGLDVLQWVKGGVDLGSEVLITAIDREGTRTGFDIDLLRSISSSVSVPVIASGGMGSMDHFIEAATDGLVDAVSMADILHYKRMTIDQIRSAALAENLSVRKF